MQHILERICTTAIQILKSYINPTCGSFEELEQVLSLTKIQLIVINQFSRTFANQLKIFLSNNVVLESLHLQFVVRVPHSILLKIFVLNFGLGSLGALVN